MVTPFGPLCGTTRWPSAPNLRVGERSSFPSQDTHLAKTSHLVAIVLLMVLGASLAACGFTSQRDRVLFSSNREGDLAVYSITSSGEDLQRLSPAEGLSYSPSWSPDYRRYLYVSRRKDRTLLVVADREGGNPRALVETDGAISHPRWSPDGKRIAYSITPKDGNVTIHSVLADGGGDAPVVFDLPLTDAFSWSPDSQWIAVASANPAVLGIYVHNPLGVNYLRLTQQADSTPLWSPKQDKIAFLSQRDGNAEVYIMDSDGSHQKRITDTSAPEYGLAWSPDGRKLAFVSERDGNPEVYVVRTTGTQLVRLTLNAFPDLEPAWSPDGRRIVFTSYRDGTADLFLMDATGERQQALTSGPPADSMPSWSAGS
ncbi:MAG: PD40 domain-containing protein [Chloroflexi bacterium]|nr:PD40 domain-containing protein [Chloroflexota bacterium]